MVNNSLVSPGYPTNYPKNMHCEYSVPIPDDLSLIINFHDFQLEKHSSCGYVKTRLGGGGGHGSGNLGKRGAGIIREAGKESVGSRIRKAGG